MKKIYYFVVSCVLAGALSTLGLAQTSSSTSGTGGTGATGGTGGAGGGSVGQALGGAATGAMSKMENVVIKHGGKLYHMQNGKPAQVTSATTLPNGTKVDPTGAVTTQDGRTMSVQEGQMVTPDGKVSNAPQNILSKMPGTSSTPDSGTSGTGTSGAGGTGGAGGGATTR